MEYDFIKWDGTHVTFDGELVADLKAKPLQEGGDVLQDHLLYRMISGKWVLVTRLYIPPDPASIHLDCEEFDEIGDLCDWLLGVYDDDPTEAPTVHRELLDRARIAFPEEFDGALAAKADEVRHESETAVKIAANLLQIVSSQLKALRNNTDEISTVRAQLLSNTMTRLRMMLEGFGEVELKQYRERYFALSKEADALKERLGLWTCSGCEEWVKFPRPPGDMPMCAKCSVETQ